MIPVRSDNDDAMVMRNTRSFSVDQLLALKILEEVLLPF
jgi:hypothetical protein